MARRKPSFPPHPDDCQECAAGTHLIPDAPTYEQVMAGTEADEGVEF